MNMKLIIDACFLVRQTFLGQPSGTSVKYKVETLNQSAPQKKLEYMAHQWRGRNVNGKSHRYQVTGVGKYLDSL